MSDNTNPGPPSMGSAPQSFFEPSGAGGAAPGAPMMPTSSGPNKSGPSLPALVALGLLAFLVVGGLMYALVESQNDDSAGGSDVTRPATNSADSTQADGSSDPGAEALTPLTITSPPAGSTFGVGDPVVVGAVADGGDIASLDVIVDGVLVASTSTAGPVTFPARSGMTEFRVEAILTDGTKATSNPVSVVVSEAGSELPDSLPVEPGTDLDQAIAVFQQFEDAAAIGDWAQLRLLEPGKASFTDQRWSDGYQMLSEAWVVPVRTVSTDGTQRTERLGLVTNELDIDTGLAISKLFCVTWRVDLAAGTMDQTGLDTVLFEPLDGFVVHTDYVEFLEVTC